MIQQLVSYISINYILSKLNINLSKNIYFNFIVFLHNVVLTIFSGYIFYNSCMIMNDIKFLENFNFSSNLLMVRDDYYYITYLFYLSKYYEFVDTWILYLKNKKPSFLQIYHHIGAVINMRNIYICRIEGGWVFVTFNSFVHTIMYIYYALSTLKIYLPFKRIITTIQILQFVIGLGLSGLYLKYNNSSQENYNVQMFINIYLCGLIILFLHFANKSYKKKTKIKPTSTSISFKSKSV